MYHHLYQKLLRNFTSAPKIYIERQMPLTKNFITHKHITNNNIQNTPNTEQNSGQARYKRKNYDYAHTTSDAMRNFSAADLDALIAQSQQQNIDQIPPTENIIYNITENRSRTSRDHNYDDNIGGNENALDASDLTYIENLVAEAEDSADQAEDAEDNLENR